VQFGINGNPTIAQQHHITIPDDPIRQHNTPGYVAFSNTGPNTRSTQIYINLGVNTARNDIEAGFAPSAVSSKAWTSPKNLWRLRRTLWRRYASRPSGPDLRRRQHLSRPRISQLDKLFRATMMKSN
jgi:cyclophilin family peptidyl-prolyl cis-trans isomerase